MPPSFTFYTCQNKKEVDMKNRYIAALLAFFLGGLGVHKFYLGKWTGIFYLALCWTYIPSIIALVEAILYLVNGEETFNEKYNKKAMENSYKNVTYDPTPSNQNVSSSNDDISIVCPKCGHVNEAGSNFCESCGQKL